MNAPKRAASARPFDLSGGALCLDFANTLRRHADPASDELDDYARFLAFVRQNQLLDSGTRKRLMAAAERRPPQAKAALKLVKRLRDALYRIFSACAAGRPLPAADIDFLNSALGPALSHRVVRCGDDAAAWSWRPPETDDLRAPLWPIVESAARLLTSEELSRVSQCAAEDCHGLFLDRSRSRSRRWCSMDSCGNRAKVRRHYRRHQRA